MTPLPPLERPQLFVRCLSCDERWPICRVPIAAITVERLTANAICPNCNADARHIVADLKGAKAAAAGHAWQPIETAPTDGTPVLTLSLEYGRWYVGSSQYVRYQDGSRGWHGGSIASIPEGALISRVTPQFWAPFPTLPKPGDTSVPVAMTRVG